jgi:[ribosomal protein S5]-alanine N-acetyltransferase
MIYAETPRLILRSLEPGDLPRVTELIGNWDVARWLAAVPHPYSQRDAEEYYARMAEAEQKGVPEYFLLQQKSDDEQIGAIGLHPSRELVSETGELVIGYWLGKAYWGQGLLSEGLVPVIDIAFKRPGTALLTATTDLANDASQNVLRKAGLIYLGTSPRRDVQETLRGSSDVTRWQLTRADYEKRKCAA